MEISLIPVLQDNYTFILHDKSASAAAVVDPALSKPLLDWLKKKGGMLTDILITHHHPDHVGGNLELQQATGCKVVGFGADAKRIPGISVRVQDGDIYEVCGRKAQIIYAPGHTLGHVMYYFPEEKALFCGDTVFAMGCGRLFEGTPEQMAENIMRISAFPDEVKIYCAHEYTLHNARFAMTLEPQNMALQERVEQVQKMRENHIPTIPTTVGIEKRTNPFFRTRSKEIRKTLGMEKAGDVEVFAAIRARRNDF